MCRHLSLILGITTLLLLAACSGTPVRGNATETEVAEKSIVVLSVSHDLGGGGSRAIFYLDEPRYPGRAVLVSRKEVLGIPSRSDFEDRRGHLYILELEPGIHTIDTWQVSFGNMHLYAKQPAAPLKFEVHKGEAVYLGNLHAKLAFGNSGLFGLPSLSAAVPVVVDQSAQDIALAESMVPALKGKVRNALLPLGPWVRDGETARTLDPAFIVPIPVK